MKKLLVFGLLGALFGFDQMLPRIADRQIRSSDIFDLSIDTLMPKLSELSPVSKKVCEIQRVYLLYYFQICFKPYTAGSDSDADGYHLVYHKPKPRLSLLMPANGPDSYYFKESSQGEFLLFVRRDGAIQYGDSR